jgi:hypothetical protein
MAVTPSVHLFLLQSEGDAEILRLGPNLRKRSVQVPTFVTESNQALRAGLSGKVVFRFRPVRTQDPGSQPIPSDAAL